MAEICTFNLVQGFHILSRSIGKNLNEIDKIINMPVNHKPCILIVDDTADNIKFLETIIRKLKVNLVTAGSGAEALEKTKKIKLALAIIDVRMPVMDGYELAEKLNLERPFEKVPIIFLTANHFDEIEIGKGYGSGAVDYLFKPINVQILRSKIEVFLDLFNQNKTILKDAVLLKRSADKMKRVIAALNKSVEKEKSALEQLQQLAQYIEKARENERASISRELHDDLGQALTAVKIDLGIIRKNVTDEETVSKINKVTALVSETIKTVQRLTSNLRPDIIYDLGLETALEWYTKEYSERYGTGVFLEMDSGISFSAEDSLTLFRIMQESLTNVARHSRATQVNISLRKNGDSVNFSISDNGIGITESQRTANNSFGIISMKERAASLNATFEVYGKNGAGTVIRLIIPLKNQ
jgi:signal transduction histidine kinase